MQIQKSASFLINTHYKMILPLLYYINSIGYQRRLSFLYIIHKTIFEIEYNNNLFYCNKYLYSYKDLRDNISYMNVYNIIKKAFFELPYNNNLILKIAYLPGFEKQT